MREPHVLHIFTLALLGMTLSASCFAQGTDHQSGGAAESQAPQSHSDKAPQPQGAQGSDQADQGQTLADDPAHAPPVNSGPENGVAEPSPAASGQAPEAESGTEASQQTQEAQSQTRFNPDQEQGKQSDSSGGSASDSTQEGQTPTMTVQNLPQMQTGSPSLDAGHSVSEAESNRRSFVDAGLNLSAAAEIVPAYGSTPFQAFTATRAFGLLDLVRVVHRFDTSIQYRGGGYFFKDTGSPWSDKQVQQLTVSEGINWKKTKLLLEDSVTDFPGASFGSNAFGGSSAYNLGLGGNSGIADFFGLTTFGFGGAQHFTNVALASLNQQLTPRSSLTFAAAYAITDYFGVQNINSQQVSGLAGYTHLLSPKSQFSVSGGYQYWRFTGYDTSDAYSVQAGYSRQLSPRIGFSVGGGPQLVISHTPTIITIGPVKIPIVVSSRQTGITGEASIGYAWGRGSAGVMYAHLVTSGSGFFAGANSDIGTFTLTKPALQKWAADFSAGYVHLSSLGNGSAGILQNAYQYWFAGAGVSRRFGRHVNLSASYQFNSETTTAGCTVASACGSIVHTALLSLSWRTIPFSLDRGGDRDVPSATTDSTSASGQNP